MKKALLALPISLVVISTASCSWLFSKTDKDVIRENNPGYLAGRARYGRFAYDGLELSDEGDELLTIIREVEEFTYAKTDPDLTGVNSFRYTMSLPSLLFTNNKDVTFYENGFAQTSGYNAKGDKYLHFYYQFDANDAKALFNAAKGKCDEVKAEERREQEERDNVEREYNEMLADMTIFTIIDKMAEEEYVSLEFYFVTDEEDPRFYDFTFKDDGSIYAVLKGAQYSEFVMPETSSNTFTPAYLNITGREWKITVDKAAESVDAEFTAMDKYYRTYSKKFNLTIDKDSLTTVLNRAYELSAPKNPFGDNTSLSPSSSSSEEQ